MTDNNDDISNKLDTDLLKHMDDIINNTDASASSRDKDGMTPLMMAVREENVETVEALCMAGIDLNEQNNAGQTAMMLAVLNGAPDAIIDALIKYGADLNIKDNAGYTALIYSIRAMETARILPKLLEAGANPNIVANDGASALMIACANNSGIEVIHGLLKAGAKSDQLDNYGWSPLMYVVRAKNKKAVEAIILAGTDLNLRNNDGETALMLSLRHSAANIDIMKLLIAAGSNIHLKDNHGRNALMYAIQNKADPMVIKILASLGTKK